MWKTAPWSRSVTLNAAASQRLLINFTTICAIELGQSPFRQDITFLEYIPITYERPDA
ncbi:hypothetical protein Z948_398 [Sulfitobacter donghicola DSW-25 = KCTC 12864 = JCM 14565]|nr:hypothetical protein Z948_398 [Sulfitobacter donghicola DSW-25 = KCTC 12864 = JCM 14565]